MKVEVQSRSSSKSSFISYGLKEFWGKHKGTSMIEKLTSAIEKDVPGLAPPHGS